MREEEKMANGKKHKKQQENGWITRTYGPSSATFYIPKIKIPEIEIPEIKYNFPYEKPKPRKKKSR